MIKYPATEEDKKRIAEWLTEKGTQPLTDIFQYVETQNKGGGDGVLRGAMGIESKICIEPLQSESKIVTFELLTSGLAAIKALGYSRAHIFTANQTAVKNLLKHYEGIVWGSKLTEVIIKL